VAGTLPNITPSRATSKATETRTLIADLGDGYQQRAGDGINTVKQHWNVDWTCTDSTDANTLIAFFEEREGYINFEWTPFRESTPRKFICIAWAETFIGNSKTQISATFEEVFDQS